MHRMSTNVPNRSTSRWHAHSCVAPLICGVLIAIVAVGIEVQGVSRPVQSRSAQADVGVRPLIVGQPAEHDLRPGQADDYQIGLSEGQYVYVTVAQDGVDVTMTLRGPGGQSLVVLDSVAALHGLEALHWIADTSGSYRVEVRSRSLDRARDKSQEAKPGRYAIRLVDLRQNTPQDRNRLDAQAARVDASQLHKQGKKAALEAAIARLNDALSLAEAAGDARGEAAALYGLGQVHADLGSLRVAAGYDERAILHFERLGDRFEEARASLRAGEAHRTMGDVRKGLEYYNRSLILMRDVKDSGGEGEALADIGEAHFMLRDMQQALRYDHEACRCSGQPRTRPQS